MVSARSPAAVQGHSGYYRLVNKQRGTVLQATEERYGSFADVFSTASSPAAWNSPEQQWRLAPG